MYYSKKLAVFSMMMMLGLGYAGTTFAAGNITSPRQYSQFLNTDLDNNGTKDFINWSPTADGATVSDTALTGNIWGDTVGWINLGPFNSSAGSTAGVKNTCSGILSGNAWGQNTGWINFGPFSTPSVQTAANPHIDISTGEIIGSVWSQNYGWITLNSSNGTYAGLTTNWRGCTTNGGGTTGGSSSSGHVTSSTTTPPITPVTPPVIPNIPTFPGNTQIPTTPGSPGTTGLNPINPPINSASNPKIIPTQNPIPVVIGATTASHFSVGSFIGGALKKMDLENSKGFAWIGTIIALLGLLSSIPGLITRFGNLLFTFIFGRKKRRGVVYDSKTKEPLDPAYVSVVDVITGKEVATAITDLEGRFGFVLKKGTYKFIVNKTHYQFPSVLLAGKTEDEVYDQLYFGDEFTITDDEEVVTMNIPMDAVEADWNQEEKRRMNIVSYFTKNQKFWGIVFDILFVIGCIISIIITYYYPVWWNILMVILYGVIALIQLFGYGPVSVGKIIKNGTPLAYAVIRVINAGLDREVAHKVTSEQGGYFILVPKDQYYITVNEKNSDGTYTQVYRSAVMKADHGLINKTFSF